jgi:hypothetical protein
MNKVAVKCAAGSDPIAGWVIAHSSFVCVKAPMSTSVIGCDCGASSLAHRTYSLAACQSCRKQAGNIDVKRSWSAWRVSCAGV